MPIAVANILPKYILRIVSSVPGDCFRQTAFFSRRELKQLRNRSMRLCVHRNPALKVL